MTPQEESHPARRSLADFVASVEADAPDQKLVDLGIASAQEIHSDLAEAVRYCAIPRRFNAQVIGILRGASEEHGKNERLLNGLLSLGFVVARKDYEYVYRDSIRQLLLEDWKSDEDKLAQFDRFNQRLVAFYEAQYGEAQQIEQDLEDVAHVVKRANSTRFTQMISAVETHILAPLLEALYHEMLRSAQTGYDFFERHYLTYESRGRVTICESLLSAARECLQHLAPGSGRESFLMWIQYWEARLANLALRYQQAEDSLRELLLQTESDTKLRFWVLAELATALRQQYKLRVARERLSESLALVRDRSVDPYNLPVSYYQLASLHSLLGEPNQATDLYQEAKRSARVEHNRSIEAHADLELTNILRNGGEWSKAFDLALEVLHYVRTYLHSDRAVYQAVLKQFMSLFAQRDPRLLDTLLEESKRLLTALGNPLEELELLKHYAVLLQNNQRLEKAEALWTEIQASLEGYSNTPFGTRTPFGTSVKLEKGILREMQGREESAIALYTEVIERAPRGITDNWDHAAALSNRGQVHARRGSWLQTDVDLQAAADKWKEMGHEVLTSLLQVFKATALSLRGQLATAQQSLDEAQPSLVDANSSYLADYYEVQGNVYRYQARWAQARDQYQQALKINRSLYSYKRVAECLGYLATVAAAQVQWDEAAQHAAEAHESWKKVSTLSQYSPSEKEKSANEKNARGMQHLFAASGDKRKTMRQARNLFESATRRVPDNLWHHLNLAYAYAELQEWDRAANTMERILGRCHGWLRSRVLYERWAEYALQHVERLFETGQYEAAAQACSTYQVRLEDLVPLEMISKIKLRLGDTLLLLGRLGEAEAEYKTALDAVVNVENIAIQHPFQERLGFLANTSKGGRMKRFQSQIAAQKPDEWLIRESITLLAPDGRTNVIASSEPLDPSIDTTSYAETQGHLLREEFPHYRELVFEPRQVLGGRQGYIRRFDWMPPDGELTTHIQLYYVEHGRGFTVTATTSSADYQRFELQLRQILDGLVIQ
jgi:tetratricopeptide (TPR) repeat protein